MFIGRTGRSTLRFYKKRTVNANLEVFKEHRTFDLEVYEEDRTVKANFKVYMEDKLSGSRGLPGSQDVRFEVVQAVE